ncbi:MAG TPA: CopG family antitoxin [Chloroflexota bacterium]|nr:CopG family antitoxin [Chloroflexota bacterium]
MTRVQKRYHRSEKRKIPEFTSIEEEAAFWDTHDTTDFEDQFTPIKVRFAKRLSEGLTIRLDPETLAELRARARERGLGPTTLVRMWILERLHETAPQADTSTRQ